MDVSSHGVPISPLTVACSATSRITPRPGLCRSLEAALARGLHAFGTCSTWTRGYYFTEEGGGDGPEHTKLPIPYRLRRQPGGDRLLCVESLGWAGGEFGVDQAVDGLRVHYWLEAEGQRELLDHLQWADWDREGHLLAATRGGKLQAWALDGDAPRILFDEDLSLLEPSPGPAPAWAERW